MGVHRTGSTPISALKRQRPAPGWLGDADRANGSDGRVAPIRAALLTRRTGRDNPLAAAPVVDQSQAIGRIGRCSVQNGQSK